MNYKLDSKLIFIKGTHLEEKARWLNITFENGAWVFIGDLGQVNKELIFQHIYQHFGGGGSFYIALDRKGSMAVERENIENEIERIIGLQDFLLCDQNFTKIIEFNKSGVMRLGVKDIV